MTRNIRPGLDHVQYYYLCAACQKRIEATAGKEVTHAEHTVIV